MKLLLTLTGLFLATFMFAQKNNCDSIPWVKERKLSWSDFKANPDTAAKDTAQSFIRLHKKWRLRGDTLTISLYSYFKPCLAWSKTKISDTLLMHEQGHFDISEYFRRLAVKKFSEQNFTRQNYKAEIENIDFAIQTAQNAFVNEYESKTDFSRNKARQEEWTRKILTMIDALKQYDLPRIVKPLIP